MTQAKTEGGKALDLRIEIKRVDIPDLVPHEGVIEEHIREITDWIRSDGFQLRPIAISRLDSLGPKWKGRLMIHDGHHRTAALKRLGCTKIMGSIFDFTDPRIKVFGYYDTSIAVSKEEVIRRATSGMEVTPRYDKHFIEVDGGLLPFHDNDILEPKTPTPLAKLK
ncbi:MAG TPA: ParB N-terminal domain-containing protein [Nitrososphaerales archaeon]|nr:ParB N-terminal domain-containing protein [Nitrososphaerales archaeon]